MRKLRFFIILPFWIIPLLLAAYLVFPKGDSRELKDSVYTVANGLVELRLEVSDGQLRANRLQNLQTKESIFLGGEEFKVSAGFRKDLQWIQRSKDEEPYCGFKDPHLITSASCLPVEVKRGKFETSFLYYYPALKTTVRLTYTARKGEEFLHSRLEVENYGEEELVINEVSLGDWVLDGNLTGGGLGLPVFVDGTWAFCGEEPWVESLVKNNTVSILQHPSVVLKEGEKWLSDRALMGGGRKDAARKALAEYIRKLVLPPKFVTVYNTWCDFREKTLTTENTVSAFLKLCDGLRQYEAAIDYCVVDDGWFRRDTVYETDNELFPGGLSEVADAIEPYGCKLGLWLSYSARMNDRKALAEKGYEAANDYYLCLSGPRYNEALRETIKNKLLFDKVGLFKHDFNYFVCGRAGHGHLYSKAQSTEHNMRATAAMLDMERELDPELHQSITTGINHSPWWLKYGHILWMGGKDKDYDLTRPVTSRAEGEMRCRDAFLYEQEVVQREFFPMYAFMTHGIINGLLDTAGPWLDDDQWADYVMNYLGRGTALREIYVHPRELNAKKFEILGRGLHWASTRNEYMLNSEMILGDPGKDELYGYRGRDAKGRVYVSLRNPGFLDREVKLDDLGIDSDYYRIVYPYHMICESKNYPTVTLAAESNLILESLELKDLEYPVLINARAERSNVTGASSRFAVHSSSDDKNDVYVYSPFKIQRVLGLQNVKEISKNLWRGDRPVFQEVRKVSCSDVTVASNYFRATVNVPDNCSVLLVWTINDPNGEMTLDMDEIEAKTRSVSFPKMGWKVVTFPLSRGEHRLTGTVKNGRRPVTLSDLQLRVAYELPAMELQLMHKVARGLAANSYELPCPVSQGVRKETVSVMEKAQLKTAPRTVWRDVESAALKLDIFDVNGGAYTNKTVFLNDVPIGLLPPNAPPISSWQTVEIPVPSEALSKIGNANTLAISDQTGDAYKIRNVSLSVNRRSGKAPEMVDQRAFCSSPTWALKEGEIMPLDGSAFLFLCE